MIHILVADDHPVIREGLKRILAQTPQMTVIGEASDGPDVLKKLSREMPDVLLLDLSMPGVSGLDLLKQLKMKHPKLPILILSQFPENQYALRVLRAGAAGYLTKESASVELISAVRKVAQGGKYVSPAVADALLTELDVNTTKKHHESLSDREYEVLRRIGTGQRLSQIAAALFLSVKTISTYRTRILEKMNLTTNAALIRYVIEHQLDVGAATQRQAPSKRKRQKV